VAFVALESTAEGSTRAFDHLTDAGLVISGEEYQRVEGGEDYVRYVEVGRELASVPAGVPCKTSVMVHLEHRAGALSELLETFSRHRVNLTRLESRPVPGAPLRSRFFIDMEGHAAGQGISEALDEARTQAECKVLGSYPGAALP
jgi:chorismate mutase / prephenate dehydratase